MANDLVNPWAIAAIVTIYLPIALVSYFLGCINGAVLTSKLFYHDDVRKHGSGNAGLTNFYRTYGAKYALCVIALDMGKAVAAALFASALLRFYGAEAALLVLGKYFAGLFCLIGHVFPVTEHFKGGKGILCCATLLLCLDWRIALTAWGLFLVVVLLTRYVSLGSVCAAISFPIMTHLVFADVYPDVLSLRMAALVIWAHRTNIVRLLRGTENKFRFRVNAPKEEEP